VRIQFIALCSVWSYLGLKADYGRQAMAQDLEVVQLPATKNSEIRILESVLGLLGIGLSDAIGSKYKMRPDADIMVEFLHPFLAEGLKASVLLSLARSTSIFRTKQYIEVLGMSPSTFYRIQKKPEERLTNSQTAQTYEFAELYAKAHEIFGSTEVADSWFQTPARQLSDEKPIELLTTPPGLQRVRDYLAQIDYGVYS
jgi:putative toxin-antitoxin system antitoxin component (TIGR02293 family)